MLSGDLSDDVAVNSKRILFFAVDGKVDEGGARFPLTALLPEAAKFAFDGADRHRDAGGETHILLQVTP